MVFPSERFFPSGTFEPDVEGNNSHTANSLSSYLGSLTVRGSVDGTWIQYSAEI